MTARPRLAASHSPIVRAGAALLAGTITLTLFATVVAALQSDGVAFERALAAERACEYRTVPGERDACLRAYDRADRPLTIAAR